MSGGPPISLPQGGGALAGIGESFTPDPHTGTGGFAVPLALPAGRGGLTPELTLGYSSGAGNGPFGLGWSLGVPTITRSSTRGVPRYDDATDRFVLDGGEELVRVGQEGATTRYRPRTEGLYADIRHRRGAGDDVWEVRTTDGMLAVYGTPGTAGVDPAVLARPDRRTDVACWHLTSTVDPFGNRVRYEYARDAGQDGPHRWDALRLVAVRYADVVDPGSGAVRFAVAVELEHTDRPDRFSEHRSGFEVRTSRRCRRISVLTDVDERRLVRTYDLTYLDERVAAGELPASAAPANGVSLLSRVVVTGHDGDRREEMAPLELGYSTLDPARRRFVEVGGPLPPRPLTDPSLQLADLFGDGLPDLVEIRDGVRFWRNRGEGRFDPPRTMDRAPGGLRLDSPGVQLLDADGDGRLDLLVATSSASGYYPLEAAGGWADGSFRRYRSAPAFPLSDPEVRLVDLDGDGVTDALRTADRFECLFHDRVEGWSQVRAVPRGPAAEFPDVTFADPRVHLADMTGDGLVDIVQVNRGSLVYWANLGHGRWGPRVTTAGVPELPTDHDPAALHFGDLDGDGAADLLLVEPGRVTAWFNRSGRAWSAPVRVTGTPDPTGTADVRLVDLNATGAEGVLWTRTPPTAGAPVAHHLDLTGGTKPYLLTEVDNGMGATTRIEYTPSTRADDPLPFCVHVVARVETTDRVSDTTLTAGYRYHHGYWDGTDREFRGFGRVDRVDTVRTAGVRDPGTAPVRETTWYHQGPVGAAVEPDREAEYWAGDPSLLGHRAGIAADLAALPAGPGSVERRRDALRALRGSVLRVETFVLDGTARATTPHSVRESAYGVRVEEPGVVLPFLRAERTTTWERGTDPATSLVVPAGYDEFGRALRRTEIAFPRRSARRRPVTAAGVGTVWPDPVEVLAVHEETRYAVPEAGPHLYDRVAEEWTYEPAAPVTVTETDPDDLRTVLRDQVAAGLALATALAADGAGRTLLRHTRHRYDGPGFTGLPVGAAGRFGALTRSETLVLTDALLDDLLGDRRPAYLGGPATRPGTPPGFGADLGYRREPEGYYADLECVTHDFQVGDGGGVGLVVAMRDPVGGVTTVDHDPLGLLPVRVVDPVGLVTEAEYDPRLLQVRRVTDANGNRADVAYSPIGLLAATWARGQEGRTEGDAVEPAVRVTADFRAFVRDGRPVVLETVRRVHRDTDAAVPAAERDLTLRTREFSDGFGRIVQVRTQADATVTDVPPIAGAGPVGPPAADPTPVADAVVVSGWTVYDGKGRPVRTSEPFLAAGWEFEPGAAEGAVTTTTYDALGRVVGVLHPDGARTRTVHGIPADLADPDALDAVEPTPWESYAYDPNDLAPVSTAPDGTPLRAPAEHHHTPDSVVVDAAGRVVCQVARNGPDLLLTRSRYDVRGRLLAVTDPAGREAMRFRYDLGGGRWALDGIDAGLRTTVADAAGRAVEFADPDGRVLLQEYDAAGRPVRRWARDDAAAPLTLREVVRYGDEEPDRAAARAANLLGNPSRRFDEAGVVDFHAYDLTGDLVARSRRTVRPDLVDADWRADWSVPDPEAVLDAAAHRTDLVLDALGRPREQRYPALADGRRPLLRNHYAAGGGLRAVELDGEPVLADVRYDPRGERVQVRYGNGLVTRHRYDPLSRRLVRTHTRRYAPGQAGAAEPAGPVLADLTLDHDPVGNVVGTSDRSPDCGVPGSALGTDALDRAFRYDPLYRLVGADGRETDLPAAYAGGGPRSADVTLARPYEETYGYDLAGSLVSLVHTQLRPGGTRATVRRELATDPSSNRVRTVTVGRTVIDQTHDAAGNLVAEGGTRAHAWDHAGRLTGFAVRAGTGPASIEARYLYGAEGDRVLKVVRTSGSREPDVTVQVDGGFEVRRRAGVEQRVVHVGDEERRVALVRYGPALPDDGAADMPVQYQLGDHLGSAHLVVGGATPADAGPVRREEFTPYGETSFGSFAHKRYRYLARERDEESGLVHVGSRYLAPWTGRWTSCDPAGIGDQTNLYAYCRGNPVSLRDVDGRASRPPPGAKVHYFAQTTKDAKGNVTQQGYSKTLTTRGAAKSEAAPGGASPPGATPPGTGGSGTGAGDTPGTGTGTGGTPGTGDTTTPGSAGTPGGTGSDPVSSPGVDGGSSGSTTGSPTGSSSSSGGSPTGTTDPGSQRSATGTGTGVTGKGSGSLTQLDLAVLIANVLSDPLAAALGGDQQGKSGGVPEGDNPQAQGNEIVQGAYVAAKAIKAAASAAVSALGSAARSGGKAVSVGTGRAYSVLHRVRLKPRARIRVLPNRWRRLSHWSEAQRSLKAASKDNAVLREAVENARAEGQWVWHHSSVEVGVMELVPATQHRASILQDLFHPKVDGRRVGGFFHWGHIY